MKGKVLVFGGTTEGRLLSDYLRQADVPHEISVATEYGKEILLESGENNLLVGRKNSGEIKDVITSCGFTIVVDATHPFATAVSAEIREACRISDVPYLRLKRDTGNSVSADENIIYVDSVDDACKKIAEIDGKVLLLTGSKDVEEIAASFPDIANLYVRVLPNIESIQKCYNAGLSGKQIIAMQGPFSKEMNIATIKELGVKAILTKESGKTGGLSEKLDAASACGVKAVVIRNPENAVMNGDYHSMEEVLEILSEHIGIDIKPVTTITLAGMGPGDERYYTRELINALDKADVIFGAGKVVENIRKSDIPIVQEYQGEKIYQYLVDNRDFSHPLVLYSGDISLCSGAKRATEFFCGKGFKVERISGISSVVLFAERLGLSLENVKIVNAHGKKTNVKWYVHKNEEAIILTSDEAHAAEICMELINEAHAAGIRSEISGKAYSAEIEKEMICENHNSKELAIFVGCDLGTDRERIIEIARNQNSIEEIRGKCLIYVKNPMASAEPVVRTLSDDEIIRGKVPMTKEEIRALSIRKLALTKDSVLWDIGAGTGSISLEAALLYPDIQVFSVEKNDEAFELLKQNKEKFDADNMTIIHGTAPEALEELPRPSHVFIGGSSGNLKEILKKVFEINERAKVVINTVTAETFAEVMECTGEFDGISTDITQLAVTRYRKVGKYHLADALNPVYVIALEKGDDNAQN